MTPSIKSAILRKCEIEHVKDLIDGHGKMVVLEQALDHLMPIIREHCALYGLNEIAGASAGRHQHALDMAALLKERAAGLKTPLAEQLYKTQRELAAAKAQIATLNKSGRRYHEG